MLKSSEKPNRRDSLKAALVEKTAEIQGVDKSYVYKVMSAERYSPSVLDTYMELAEGVEEVFKKQMLKAVNELVPFNN
jgi:DNA-binding protein Fis